MLRKLLLILFAAVLPLAALAQGGPGTGTNILFVMGQSDADAARENGGYGGLGQSTFLAVYEYDEGTFPKDGRVSLLGKAALFVINTGLEVVDFSANQPQVKKLDLIYADNEVVGFDVDIQTGLEPNLGKKGDYEVGIVSAVGTQDGITVNFTEDHGGTAPISYGDWPFEPFGRSVERRSNRPECNEFSWVEDTRAEKFTLSFEEGCFWMENITGSYCWVDAPQGKVDKARCKQLDSCSGGDGESGGGCYKYSKGYAAPRLAWD